MCNFSPVLFTVYVSLTVWPDDEVVNDNAPKLMPRHSKIFGCSNIPNATAIATRPTISVCDFLAPAIQPRNGHHAYHYKDLETFETLFYRCLHRAAKCQPRRRPITRVNFPSSPCTWWRDSKQERVNNNNVSRNHYRSLSSSACRYSVQDTRKPARNGAAKTQTQTQTQNKPTGWEFFDSNTLEFARTSRLPLSFFHDLGDLQEKERKMDKTIKQSDPAASQTLLEQQMTLIQSVRQLEQKLAKAKANLTESLSKNLPAAQEALPETAPADTSPPRVVLSKEDYKNLVDLYFHTHTSRFDPGSPHSSPTPTFLEDYAFTLSEDFAPPQAYADFDTDEEHGSPLKEIEEMMKSNKLREIAVFQSFVDLLLNDSSSNAALFRAYKRLPQPGVAFLPTGTVRFFLQRMSTPWQKSEKSMIRYLSLIDDMQAANLPISRAEWASAIYLAGRSFGQVTGKEVNTAMRLWTMMEQEAGVKSNHVTFNILFDIAVRANKYPLAQMILREMHTRRLHLNRLGRVSLIYYHGLRGDGDAVRKAYRDFIDAGEIVDTLVLNCVIGALYHAQEPSAAEQIYERMKSLHLNTRRETRPDGSIVYYRQYPGPGSALIDRELAANALHRTLLSSRRLKDILPQHHRELQEIIPLRPDHVTFRTMIAYHANVSGNLNRITVLVSEMSELFELPMQSINYQLLFKGFALHGASQSLDATWSVTRLNMVWESCLEEIKAGQKALRRARNSEASAHHLPRIDAINDYETRQMAKDEKGTKFKRLSEWDEFVLDLAAFPRERRKHIERIHAELFDDEEEEKESLIPNPFARSRKAAPPPPPQRQDHYYSVGERKLDEQEGEYVLPSPILTIDPSSTEFQEPFFPPQPSPNQAAVNPDPADDVILGDEKSSPSSSTQLDSDEDDSWAEADLNFSQSGRGTDDSSDLEKDDKFDSRPIPTTSKYQVVPDRALVCWLLRAYANCTGSRPQVEAVWESMRKVWKMHDENDQAAVIRVLKRCLRNCDRFGPPM